MVRPGRPHLLVGGEQVTPAAPSGSVTALRARPGQLVLEHLLGQPGRPAGRALDLPGQSPQLGVAHGPAEQLAVAEDQGQQVVEIVRHPALLVCRRLQLPVQGHPLDGRSEPAAERPRRPGASGSPSAGRRAYRWRPPTSPRVATTGRRWAPPATTRRPGAPRKAASCGPSPGAAGGERGRSTTPAARTTSNHPPAAAGRCPAAARHHRPSPPPGRRPMSSIAQQVGEGRDARRRHLLERALEVVADRRPGCG